MKRSFRILFFSISFLTLGFIAKSANVSCKYVSGNIITQASIFNVGTASCMNENKPAQTRFMLLFRNGVDEKGLMLKHALNPVSSSCFISATDNLSSNKGLVRYVLTFSHLLALPPEFLSSSNFRSPPVLA